MDVAWTLSGVLRENSGRDTAANRRGGDAAAASHSPNTAQTKAVPSTIQLKRASSSVAAKNTSKNRHRKRHSLFLAKAAPTPQDTYTSGQPPTSPDDTVSVLETTKLRRALSMEWLATTEAETDMPATIGHTDSADMFVDESEATKENLRAAAEQRALKINDEQRRPSILPADEDEQDKLTGANWYLNALQKSEEEQRKTMKRGLSSVDIIQKELSACRSLGPMNLRGTVGLLGYVHPMFHYEHGDTYAKYDNHNPQQHEQDLKKTSTERRLNASLAIKPVKLTEYAQRRKAEIQESFAEGGSAKWAYGSQRRGGRLSWLSTDKTSLAMGLDAGDAGQKGGARRRGSMGDAPIDPTWQVWRQARSVATLDVLREHRLWHAVENMEKQDVKNPNVNALLSEKSGVASAQGYGTSNVHDEASSVLMQHGFV